MALALLMLAHTWIGGELQHRLVGGGGDPLGFVWYLAWLPHALSRGSSPLFTTVLMAPQGANLLNSTSIFLPALVLWPVTSALGPVISYDVLATAALPLSAFVYYLVLRRITPYRSSAWLGGAIYGFCGYIAGQAAAHVDLTIAVFPPLAALLLDEARRGSRPYAAGLLLAACAAAQVFIDEEILATTTILAVVIIGLTACVAPPSRARLARHLRVTAAGAALFVLLTGPAIGYELFGPQHVHGRLLTAGRYVNDLAGFVVPSSAQLLSTPGSRHLANGFSGFDGEFGSYLGVPLIALLVWACWRLRRRALLPAGLLALAAILSLGPHLRVLGHDTGIWLPWSVPNHMPLLENAVPDRFNLYIWLAAAALLVMLLDDLRLHPPAIGRALALTAIAAALAPILPSLVPSEVVAVPVVAREASVLHRIAPGAQTVLLTPFTDGQLAMYAQAQAGFAYRIPDGGVFVPGPTGPSYGMRQGPLLYALAELGEHASTQAGRTRADRRCLRQLSRQRDLGRDCRAHYLAALQTMGIDTVIVTHHGGRASVHGYSRFFTQLLGVPRSMRGADVFRMSSSAAPTGAG